MFALFQPKLILIECFISCEFMLNTKAEYRRRACEHVVPNNTRYVFTDKFANELLPQIIYRQARTP